MSVQPAIVEFLSSQLHGIYFVKRSLAMGHNTNQSGKIQTNHDSHHIIRSLHVLLLGGQLL